MSKQLNIFTEYGLEICRPKAQFIAESMRKPKYDIYRIDGHGFRYYYRFDEKGEPVFCLGVTSLISKTRPMGYGLKAILVDKGWDGFKDFMNERAGYGTWMHMMWNKLLLKKTVSNRETDLDKSMYDYCEKSRLLNYYNDSKIRAKWLIDMQSDLLAFAAWVDDHRVVPLIIEQPLLHSDGYGGSIDLLCELTVQEKGYWGEVYKTGPRAGQEKETKQDVNVIAVVDYKSGRNAFFPDFELQLHAYRNLVNENYPDIKIDRLYNLSPKNWGNTEIPAYNFKDQTKTPVQEEFPHLLALAKIQNKLNKPSDVFQYECDIEIGKPMPESCKYVTIDEVVKQLKGKIKERE